MPHLPVSNGRESTFVTVPPLRLRRASAARCASRVSPRCALADRRSSVGAGGSAESISSFDQLAVHLWQKIFGSRNGRGGEKSVISSPVTSFGSSDGEWRYILSTTVIANAGSEARMAALLADLSNTADACGVLTRAVNQDPDCRETFLVLERFASQNDMTKYQRSEKYQAFIRDAQPLLAKPMGVYLCKEQDGKITSGFYPFGPAGEGGRDDMVFR